ncbi:MAG: class I SAM-dependent methyltransferase [Coriobacteriia bacterium]|nr:class I SAM-dependent methyltransferase [Coriobacteriia bacterium]
MLVYTAPYDDRHRFEMRNGYELLDSGDGRKLERFGDVVLSRPCGQAVWERRCADAWTAATAAFDKDEGWTALGGTELPPSWDVTIDRITLRLKPSPAGHLGVFPETRWLWGWVTGELSGPHPQPPRVLNLFAYSGGATLAAAGAGCLVCHVDSSKAMVTRARQNAALNQLEAAPIRWIVEDVGKFLDREARRGRVYDAIMLDPPSFGRGTAGEQYRIDKDLGSTLERCRAVLSDTPRFVLLTSHTLGVTVEQLQDRMKEVFGPGQIASGAMELTGESAVRPVTDGVWVRWSLPTKEGSDV